jgi:CheY-like chemotaxis protein
LSKHVLVVDDNATNRRILTKYAESWNMQTTLASSGPAALQLLAQSTKVDIALIDMQMPEMDGMELAAALHRLPGYEQLPVVLLTSIGRQTPTGEESHLAASLTKPVKAAQLAKTLQSVLYPAQPASPATSQASSQASSPVATPPDNQRLGDRLPLRILLAEDNLVNQKVALRILQRLGYAADLAVNGREVIEHFAHTDYDLILMDVQMPEIDGIEATKILRRQLAAARQPYIVAMTAHAMERDRETCLAAGMNHFISKPVHIDALSAALEQCSRVHMTDKPNAIRPTDA